MFIFAVVIALSFIIMMVYYNEGCKKTAYPEKPRKPPQKTPLSELIKELKPNSLIDQIILAIALIEQPDGGYNYNYWGVHTDTARWPYSDMIDYRVCNREGLTGKAREYAGWETPQKAVEWMRKIISLKYKNFVKKYGYFDFARFYSEKWKGGGYQRWWNDKFAQAGQILKGRV